VDANSSDFKLYLYLSDNNVSLENTEQTFVKQYVGYALQTDTLYVCIEEITATQGLEFKFDMRFGQEVHVGRCSSKNVRRQYRKVRKGRICMRQNRGWCRRRRLLEIL
jgi:hypothetical protein